MQKITPFLWFDNQAEEAAKFYVFVVKCETQEEIDYYWEELTVGGGKEVQCGWLADKYGLSWQVVPNKWDEWGKDAAGMQRLMHALMQMKKIDLAALERAYKGPSRTGTS